MTATEALMDALLARHLLGQHVVVHADCPACQRRTRVRGVRVFRRGRW